MKRLAFTITVIGTLLLTVSAPLLCLSQGATMSNPIVMNSYGAGAHTYTDSRNTSSYGNEYGQASPDIFYRFTVSGTTTISISTCGSGWDTYLWLLNSSGAELIHNDDNGAACPGLQASIVIPSGLTTITSLAAGTYYIVAEGYSTNTGVVNLTVNLTVQGSGPTTYNTKNFIRAWEATAPETDANNLITRELREVKQVTQYFDGLGRPEQSVIKKGSLQTNQLPTDLVSPIVYDEFGRESQKYLPYAAVTNDGSYKTGAVTGQTDFYNSTSSPVYGQGEGYFYGKTNFEASPLNRVEKTMAPGNSWVGNNRGMETKYWSNTTVDNVKIWQAANGAIGVFGTYSLLTSVNGGTYPAGELLKNVTVDEHGKQVIEFKDKGEKIILKKVQLTALADDGFGRNYDGWLCTYYIYDDLNNLRCVIQPEGVKRLAEANWANCSPLSDAGLLNEQCFRYEYDDRNRMTMKKVPGAGEVWMIYDAKDRLVLMQDANMRNAATKKWMYTLYDGFNRPIASGLWNNAQDRLYHQGQAETSTTYPNLAGQTIEEMTRTFYDNYDWLASNSGHGFTANRSIADDGYLLAPSSSFPYPQAVAQSNALKGKVTGTKMKVLGTFGETVYLYAITYYDDKGRLIQAQAQNYNGGVDITTTQYSWSGQPLLTINKTDKAWANTQVITVLTQFTYDDLGRLIKTQKKVRSTLVNGGTMPVNWTTTVQNEYDAFGQLKKKTIGNKPGAAAGTPLANFEYSYNIRGWLLSINKDYIAAGTNNDQYFGMELGYDKNASLGSFAAQYNGNISGTVWKSEGDQQKRKYDFSYDAVNRLLKADFTQYVSGTGTSAVFDISAGVNFSMGGNPLTGGAMKYDANGNIMEMWQTGLKLNTSDVIDKLSYFYHNGSNSNKLAKVTDDVTTDNKLGDFKNGSNSDDDYSYDANGNMIYDRNKKIDWIDYNFLNLPQGVTIRDNSNVTNAIIYKYDAAGNKIQKEVYPGAVPPGKTTLYLGACVFEDNILQFISHEEGRIRFVPASPNTCPAQPDRFVYDYFLKDHLGNVRSVLTEQKEDICYIPATVEDTRYQTEDDIYSIVDGRRIDKATAGASSVASFESKVYRTHGGLTNEKSGLGVVLKVMAGDQVKINAESFYIMPGGGQGSPTGTIALTELLAAFTGSYAVTATHGVVSTGDVSNAGTNSTAILGFLNNRSEGSNNARAFLNWILLDEQFKYVRGDVEEVQPGGGYKLHTKFINSPVNVEKSGYLYIYVSNESNFPVFFDNLGITHTPGPLLDETHYYPLGLTMAGISSRALAFGSPENKYKFNKGSELQNKEFSDGSGLEWYATQFRMYDPQIGRWHVVDPRPMDMLSPYAAMENNPILRNDPLGDTTNYYDSRTGEFLGTIYGSRNLGDVTINRKVFNTVKAIFETAGDGLKTLLSGIASGEALKKLNSLVDGFIANKIEGISNSLPGSNYIDLNNDVGLTARIGYAEFRGSNTTEQKVGMDITLNRVGNPRYAPTLLGVITQPSQYSSLRSNDSNRPFYDDPYSKARENSLNFNAWTRSVSNALKVNGGERGISQGATLYYSPRSMVPAGSIPKWNFSKLTEVHVSGVRSSHIKLYTE